MRLVCLKSCKLYHAWQSCEEAICAHGVVVIFFGKRMSLVCFGLCYNSPLQLNLIHISRRLNTSLIVSLIFHVLKQVGLISAIFRLVFTQDLLMVF